MRIGEHARRRGRERVVSKKQAFEKLVGKALELGLREKDLSGQALAYFSALHNDPKYGASGIPVLYGEHVYIFSPANRLLTVYVIPEDKKLIMRKAWKNR